MSIQFRFLLIIPLFLLLLLLPFLFPFLGEEGGVVTLERPVDSPIFEQFDTPYLFVFFGYVGCRDICTPRLQELANVYDGLDQKIKSKVGVLFVNIKHLQDKSLADLFVKSIHHGFHGVSPDPKERDYLVKQFSVYYSDSLLNPGEIDHTAFLFLLKKDGLSYRLEKIFTQVPLRRSVIISNLE